MKHLILRNKDILFGDPDISAQQSEVYGATTLQEIDEAFCRRMACFDDLIEFYQHNSSSNYLHNVKLPLLLLNARDDPIVPEQLYVSPKKHVHENPNAMFVVTEHGGHLGYYEGGLIGISDLTWLDRSLLQYILAVLSITSINASKTSYC
ncbi:predicted protein [Nematostella vectensis]|uniref:AB hydrolase-1 domain-containing protein n=1 Tax=Nematostella vectensis TaxID=45351 RepID=A7SQ49_NEMVE|nr:predicted protein [Nematostella vectensis]|eukprot:XP_001626254.1 predicted protein [Nematostella vectensis]